MSNPESLQAEARNPATLPDQLAELARDATLAPLVTANPNVPLPTYVELGQRFPREWLDNPLLSLLLIENPNFLGTLEPATQLSLLRLEDLPPLVLKVLTTQAPGFVRFIAAMHVQVAGEAPASWRNEIEQLILQYGSNTTITADLFHLPGLFTSQQIQHWAARYPRRRYHAPLDTLSVDILVRYATAKDVQNRQTAAMNPELPARALASLAHDPQSQIRQCVAQNPATSAETLTILAEDEVHEVRLAVARHPHTPPAILAQLCTKHNDRHLRVALATHPRLPVEMLTTLAHDHDPRIRAAVARNPLAPLALLERLANDAHVPVQMAALQHPKLPEIAFWTHRYHPNAVVRAIIAGSHRLDSAMVLSFLDDPDEHWMVQVAAAANGRLSALTIRQLAARFIRLYLDRVHRNSSNHDEQMTILHGLARNPKTTGDVLAQLAVLENTPLNEIVVVHSRTPPDVLRHLARNKFLRSLMVLHNPSTPFDVLLAWAESAAISELPAVALRSGMSAQHRREMYARHLTAALHKREDPVLRFLLLQTAVDVAPSKNGGTDVDWSMRLVTALHPQTDGKTLAMLTHDGNRYVRAAAREQAAIEDPLHFM